MTMDLMNRINQLTPEELKEFMENVKWKAQNESKSPYSTYKEVKNSNQKDHMSEKDNSQSGGYHHQTEKQILPQFLSQQSAQTGWSSSKDSSQGVDQKHDPSIGRGRFEAVDRGRGGDQESGRRRGGFQEPDRGRGGDQESSRGSYAYPESVRERGVDQESGRGRGGYQESVLGRGGVQESVRGRGGFQESGLGRGGNQESVRGRGGFQESVLGSDTYPESGRGRGGYQESGRERGGYQESRSGRAQHIDSRREGGFNPDSSQTRGHRGNSGYQSRTPHSEGYNNWQGQHQPHAFKKHHWDSQTDHSHQGHGQGGYKNQGSGHDRDRSSNRRANENIRPRSRKRSAMMSENQQAITGDYRSSDQPDRRHFDRPTSQTRHNKQGNKNNRNYQDAILDNVRSKDEMKSIHQIFTKLRGKKYLQQLEVSDPDTGKILKYRMRN